MTKTPSQIPSELQMVYPESEVRLTDLALVMYRRRRLFFLVLAACLLAAAIYVELRPAKYAFTTTIEIGSLINEEDGKKKLMPLEPSKSVVTKLEQAYIPAVMQERNTANEKATPIMVKVTAPKDTELVVLESKGAARDADNHLEVQRLATAKLIEDHQRRLVPLKIDIEHTLYTAKARLQELTAVDALELKKQQVAVPLMQEKIKLERLKDPQIFGSAKKDAEDGLRVARMKLEELVDPRIMGPRKQALEDQVVRAKLSLEQMEGQYALLGAEQKSIEAKQKLIENQLEALNVTLSGASGHRRAMLDTKSDTTAMTVMMMDTEIQQNRNRISELEDLLYIALPEKKLKLEQEKDENRRSQLVQQQRINTAELELQKFLADNDRDIERQKMVISQSERKLDTLVTENRMELAVRDPVMNELNVRARKLVPDHEREVGQQKQLISELEEKLANLRETHLVVAPMQSLATVGTSAMALLAGALALGLFGGLVAVFIAEFIGKVKGEIAQDALEQRVTTAPAVSIPEERIVAPITRLARDGSM